jgi:dTDP-4-dehydrorhamnose 3,5-epimerase
MEVETLAIPDVLLLHAPKRGDHRGFFSETYRQDVFERAGFDVRFVQDNYSFSAAKGVLRGMHWQTAPAPQAKLVRCLKGRILDVVVDIRTGSPTYGQHVIAELSDENWTQIYVPVGFAHGFCTLSENCEVFYKVTSLYAPQYEGGLKWDDPDLGIDWPIDRKSVTLSGRDKEWPPFKGFVSPF